MAIAHYLAQVRWLRDNALPEDTVVNTLHFIGNSGATTRSEDITVIAEAIDDALQPIETFTSSVLSGVRNVVFYDLNDPEPRAPIGTIVQSYIVPSTQPLPSEVALCLSFQAARVSGEVQSRRRGRIYVGPLNTSALASGESAGGVRPAPAFITALAGVGTALANDVALGDLPWAVYSPTEAAAGAGDFAWAEVTDGWVDNAFDTQRRRGAASTARTTWT